MARNLGARLWTAGLTGIPFGIYKFGIGWYEFQHGRTVTGAACMTWGVIDILLNVVAVIIPKQVGFCLLSNIGRWIDRATGKRHWENILLGIDTLLAFSIASIMIWFGRLPLEPEIMARIWNLAVVTNVLAVGLQQIWQAVADARRAERAA